MTISPLDAADLRALADLLGAAETYARSELAKAATPKAISARNAMFAEVQPEMAADLGAYFTAMARRVGATIKKAREFDWSPASIDWKVEDAELGLILTRWWSTLGKDAYLAVSEQLGVDLAWDLKSEGVAAVLDKVATRVTLIDDASREMLREAVDRAAADGLSVDELASNIRDLVGSWASTAAGEAGTRSWAIAATETATAYNSASTAGYRESGLVEVVDVYDGPECGWTEHDDPDLADGSQRTLDEADEYPTSHPHCQRAFGPVVSDGATNE